MRDNESGSVLKLTLVTPALTALISAFSFYLYDRKYLLTQTVHFLQKILQDMCVELTDYESQVLCDKFDPKKQGR